MSQIKQLQPKEGVNCNLKNNCIGNCNPLGVPCYKHKAMNNMKIISPKYGVTIVAILAPEGSTGYTVIGNKIIFDINHGLNNKRFDLPEGPYESIGIATEITEEQWRKIMPIEKVMVQGIWPIWTYNGMETATEAGLSLLEANEVYYKNPLGEEPPYPVADHMLDASIQWHKAEANTGTWVILMKQND